jgi:hypothetical protein
MTAREVEVVLARRGIQGVQRFGRSGDDAPRPQPLFEETPLPSCAQEDVEVQ